VTRLKTTVRAAMDRFLRPYFDQVAVELATVRSDIGAERDELGAARDELGAARDELGAARSSTEAQIAEARQRFGDVEASLVHQLEGQAQRQAELRAALEEHERATKQALEKLELLFMAQLEGLFGSVETSATSVRSDVVELTRMLRMQGDAADQVAEVLGRTLASLSMEVGTLSAALQGLQARSGEEVTATA